MNNISATITLRESYKNAIKEEHRVDNDIALHIAKYILDEYTTADEEDIEYFVDNIRIKESTYEAIDYETEGRTAYDIVNSMDDILEHEHLGKSIAHIWLEKLDWHKVDIPNKDIWFTIYS